MVKLNRWPTGLPVVTKPGPPNAGDAPRNPQATNSKARTVTLLSTSTTVVPAKRKNGLQNAPPAPTIKTAPSARPLAVAKPKLPAARSRPAPSAARKYNGPAAAPPKTSKPTAPRTAVNQTRTPAVIQRPRNPCTKPSCANPAFAYNLGHDCPQPLCAPCLKLSYHAGVYPMRCGGCDTSLTLYEVRKLFGPVGEEYPAYCLLDRKHKECDVCCDESSDHPLRHALKCRHWSTSCKRCLAAYVRHELDNGRLPTCPSQQCDQPITAEDLAELVQLDAATLAKYEAVRKREEMRGRPGFHGCIREGCGWWMVLGRGKPGRVWCVECRTEQCAKHHIPWHAGQTCAQYDAELKRNERMAEKADVGARTTAERRIQEKWEKRHTRRCPKCEVLTYKTAGCDHIICTNRGCRFEYCWVCLTPHKEILQHGNHRHKEWCKNYYPTMAPNVNIHRQGWQQQAGRGRGARGGR